VPTNLAAAYRNADVLRGMYEVERLSMTEIGRRMGCNSGTVIYWMRKLGVTTRTQSEAVARSPRVDLTCMYCGTAYQRRIDEAQSRDTFCSVPCHLESLKRRRMADDEHRRRVKARERLNVAVAGGHVVKPSNCPSCGSTKRLDAHHEDYDLPLDVHWRCRPCHHGEFHPGGTRQRLAAPQN
jgi:hypothetical protein